MYLVSSSVVLSSCQRPIRHLVCHRHRHHLDHLFQADLPLDRHRLLLHLLLQLRWLLLLLPQYRQRYVWGLLLLDQPLPSSSFFSSLFLQHGFPMMDARTQPWILLRSSWPSSAFCLLYLFVMRWQPVQYLYFLQQVWMHGFLSFSVPVVGIRPYLWFFFFCDGSMARWLCLWNIQVWANSSSWRLGLPGQRTWHLSLWCIPWWFLWLWLCFRLCWCRWRWRCRPVRSRRWHRCLLRLWWHRFWFDWCLFLVGWLRDLVCKVKQVNIWSSWCSLWCSFLWSWRIRMRCHSLPMVYMLLIFQRICNLWSVRFKTSNISSLWVIFHHHPLELTVNPHVLVQVGIVFFSCRYLWPWSDHQLMVLWNWCVIFLSEVTEPVIVII